MASLTRTDWIKVFRMLKGIYTFANFIGDDEAKETWYYALCRYPKEQIEDAVRLWVEENKNPPTPADIKEYIGRLGQIRTVNLNDRWRFWKVIEDYIDGKPVLDEEGNPITNEYATPKDWNESRLRYWLKERAIDVPLTAIREAR